MFEDGSNWEPTGKRPERADAEARQRRALPATIEETAFHERIESPGFGRPLIHAGPCPESIGGPAHHRSTSFSGRIADPHPLPSQQFQALFDSLFKFLFIFPSRGLGPGQPLTMALQTIIRMTEPPDSKAGLFPVHSPLLREFLRSTGPPDACRGWGARGRLSFQVFLGAFRVGVRWSPAAHAGRALRGRGEALVRGFDNDPSAGSPTETLLRLLLPLNDKVQWTSRDVAGSEPPTSPRSKQFTGSFNR
ncbi:hypothetical protein CQW23_34907 [Capsicum baccatum]|uniref:Uncharacterized protein n=1 Tax=Capsicum baccatum TaxID=33114 RepID=A0A2G2UXI1_CAPBA|nr:hypothetical protein CQW23_34907 [Capsicum baccatum]